MGPYPFFKKMDLPSSFKANYRSGLNGLLLRDMTSLERRRPYLPWFVTRYVEKGGPFSGENQHGFVQFRKGIFREAEFVFNTFNTCNSRRQTGVLKQCLFLCKEPYNHNSCWMFLLIYVGFLLSSSVLLK